MKRTMLRIFGAILALPSAKFARLGKAVFPVVILGLTFAKAASAETVTMGVVDWFASLIASIATYLAQVVGQIILLLIDMVAVPLMQYNGFVTSPVVSMGWSVVRDAVNMFFVIILIIIAFFTILGVERFKWRQQIPSILIMAVVINFSRTLCGIMIDFSQVIMLTFVNAIKDIAGGNFIQMFQLKDIMNANGASGVIREGVEPFDLLAAGIVALLMMLIVLVSLVFLTIALAYRIVMLWALVTIAPLAWFFKPVQSILGMKKNPYNEWWSKFTCALQLGPVLVFFLWLALAVAGSGDVSTSSGFETSSTADGEGLDVGSMLTMMDTSHMVSFIVGILLLFVGLDAANDACASADGVTSGLMKRARGWSKNLAMAPVTVSAWGAKKGAKTIWSGQSGGGGIKGKVLGSQTVTNAALALGRMPILQSLGGRKLAEVAAKNRVKSAASREKYDKDFASAVGGAGDFKNKSETELRLLLDVGNKLNDPATARAAIQAMSDKGLFKDNPSLTSDERRLRIENIQKARNKLRDNPETLESFDDRIRKQSPGFAMDTIYRDAKGKIDQDKLRGDITNLKIGAGAILSGTNSENAAAVSSAMGKDSADRMKFVYDVFEGNVKNIKAAIAGIEDSQIREAMFGNLDANKVKDFAQKIKLNDKGEMLDAGGTVVKDAKFAAMVPDYNKRDAILSAVVGAGVNVGEVRDFYTDSRGEVNSDAHKAMGKHVGSNADSYKEVFDDMADSNLQATKDKARDQLLGIFNEVGDIISGEGMAKIHNGGNKLKDIFDEALNTSLIKRGTNLQAPGLLPGQYTEMETALKNAVEKAIKSGSKINLAKIVGSGSGLTPATQTVINTTISGAKAEDLIKMRFDSGSAAAVGKLIWDGSNVATLKKILLDGTNKAMLKALDAYAAPLPVTDKRAALKEFFP